MPPVSTDTITVVCPCGKKLKAPASAAGKKAKCPACGNVMKLEASSGGASTASAPVKASSTARGSAPPPPPPPPPAEDDGGVDLGDLYALAAVEKEARSSGAVDESPRCPKCFTELPTGAVLCTNCGFDLRARKQITVKTGDAKPGKPQGAGVLGYGKSGGGKKDKMAPQGSFFVGLGCCAGFAAAGAVVYYLIGYFTGIQFAIVAMGVGALAGVGMQIGQKGYSKLGGLTAAAMTLVAIILANVAIVVTYLKHPEGETKKDAQLVDKEKKIEEEEAKYDHRVLYTMQTEERKLHPPAAAKAAPKAKSSDEDEEDFSDMEDAYLEGSLETREAVLTKLRAMPKTEYDAKIAKLDEDEERQELVSHLVDEELTKRNVSIHQSSYEDHYNDARKIAKTQIAGMTRDQVKAQLGPRKAKQEAELQQEIAAAKANPASSSNGSATAVKASIFIIFLLLLFGWKSILFVILGMFFAYKTAAGAVSG